MNLRIIKVVILGLIVLLSCQKEVSLNVPELQNQPVFIEGLLTPGKKPKIYVSNSQYFFSEDVTPQEVFARGADVAISEGEKVYYLYPDSIYNMFRCRWELFFTTDLLPEYGKQYNLQVAFEGKNYSATTSIKQHTAKIKSVEYIPEFFDIYGGHDGVIINISDEAGKGDYYRFQMDRMIDKTVFHAHSLDGFVNTCAEDGELFPVTDIGRIIFSDEYYDGGTIEMYIEVSYEYSEGDEGTIYIQTLDKKSAEFYTNLDEQLKAIKNPFVEPVFIKTQIEGALGVFGSAVLSDSVHFVYPQDNP